MTDEQGITEEWRPVVGFEDRNEVSSLGRVKSLSGRGHGHPLILKPNGIHYLKVGLGPGRHGKSENVHVLVAAAFIGPRPEGMEINHKDGDKKNNRPGNLEYVTQLGNARHAVAHGLIPRGEKSPRAKITEATARAIRAAAMGPRTRQSIADEFGVSRSLVHAIKIAKCWKYMS